MTEDRELTNSTAAYLWDLGYTGEAYEVQDLADDACDPVGLAEIAERLRVKPDTATMWNYRGLLPEPSWFISGRPAWNWPAVRKWAEDTGRT